MDRRPRCPTPLPRPTWAWHHQLLDAPDPKMAPQLSLQRGEKSRAARAAARPTQCKVTLTMQLNASHSLLYLQTRNPITTSAPQSCHKYVVKYLHLTQVALFCNRISIISNQNDVITNNSSYLEFVTSNSFSLSSSAEKKSGQLIYCCCSHSECCPAAVHNALLPY